MGGPGRERGAWRGRGWSSPTKLKSSGRVSGGAGGPWGPREERKAAANSMRCCPLAGPTDSAAFGVSQRELPGVPAFYPRPPPPPHLVLKGEEGLTGAAVTPQLWVFMRWRWGRAR